MPYWVRLAGVADALLAGPNPDGRDPRGEAGAPAAHAVEMFAEIRAYGESLVIAEQIPAKLVPDVIKNTAVKIVHRLPAADDRQAVGATPPPQREARSGRRDLRSGRRDLPG